MWESTRNMGYKGKHYSTDQRGGKKIQQDLKGNGEMKAEWQRIFSFAGLRFVLEDCSKVLLLRQQNLLLSGVTGHMFRRQLSVSVTSLEVQTKAYLGGGGAVGMGASECDSIQKGCQVSRVYTPNRAYNCSFLNVISGLLMIKVPKFIFELCPEMP